MFLGAIFDMASHQENQALAVEKLLLQLRFSNVMRETVVRLVRYRHSHDQLGVTDSEARRLIAKIGRAHVPELLELWDAQQNSRAGDATVVNNSKAKRIARAREILDRKDPLSIGDLAISGADVMAILDQAPGPQIGVILRRLLDCVLDDPTINTKPKLTALVLADDREE